MYLAGWVLGPENLDGNPWCLEADVGSPLWWGVGVGVVKGKRTSP